MSIRAPRLVIVDPSLVDARGHHYSLTLLLTRGARLGGVDVIWFTHKAFDPSIGEKGVEVYPIFSATMYDRYRPETKDKLPPNPNLVLLQELNEGIAQAALGPEDHVYFHTAFGDVYLALREYLKSDWRDKPYLHLCTPYDLDTMPGRDPGSSALKDFMGSLGQMEAVDKKVFFWAETPQLARHYTITYGFNTRALPLPPAKEEAPAIAASASEGAPVTALYLGAAREEKGFTLLPQLVERLYDTHGKIGRLKFVIQCTPQIIGYLPVIRDALEKLSKFPAPYVTLIDQTLGEDDYHGHLLASDIVLLLYSRRTYRIRGSGIAVEGVCGDKCLLTFTDTFCASLLTDGGGEAVDTVDDAVVRLANMVDQWSQYRSKAALQGARYRNVYGVRKYVSRLMNQPMECRRMPFLPSSIVGYVSPLLCSIGDRYG